MSRYLIKESMERDSHPSGDLKIIHLTTAFKWIDIAYDGFEDVLDNIKSRTCKSCKYYQDEDKEALQGYCKKLLRRESRSHCCNKWEYVR